MKRIILFIALMPAYTAEIPARVPDIPLMPCRSGGKWGYCDTAKKFVIKPRFDYAWPLRDGLAMVLSAGKYGYVNPAGILAIMPSYQAAGEFREGLAPVKLNGAWGYIDNKAILRRIQLPTEESRLIPMPVRIIPYCGQDG